MTTSGSSVCVGSGRTIRCSGLERQSIATVDPNFELIRPRIISTELLDQARLRAGTDTDIRTSVLVIPACPPICERRLAQLTSKHFSGS